MLRKNKKNQNAHAKAAGGYVTFDPSPKNSHARLFYTKSASKEIRAFSESLNREVERARTPSEIRSVFDKFNNSKMKTLELNADQIVKKWISLSEKESRGAFSRSLKAAVGSDIAVSFGKRSYDALFQAAIRQNVGLIKSVAQTNIINLQTVVYDSFTRGLGSEGIRQYLKDQTDLSINRIKFIARDQSAKASESLSALQMKDAGINLFEWMTFKDERVSTGKGGHKQLDGKIFAWDEPENYPEIDSQGNTGVPGQRPNCRCKARAVILKRGYEAVQNSDGSYTIVKER